MTCVEPGPRLFPASGELPRNGQLLLDVSGVAVGLVVPPRFAPVLLDGNRRWPLTVGPPHQPFPSTARRLLATTRQPPVGRKLVYEAGPGVMGSIDDVLGRDGEADPNGTFHFSSRRDTRPPRWRAPPALARIRYRELGIISIRGFDLRTAVDDDSGITIAAEVRGTKNGALFHTTPSPDGTAAVTTNNCDRRLEFEDGERYLVSLTAIDHAGQATPAPGPPLAILFQPPAPLPPAASPSPSPPAPPPSPPWRQPSTLAVLALAAIALASVIVGSTRRRH